MTNPLILLPCCIQCNAVQTEKSWFKLYGAVAKTTKKLSTCTKCHFDRYCSTKCQSIHWTSHKMRYTAKGRKDGAKEVLPLVSQAKKKDLEIFLRSEAFRRPIV